MTDKKSGTVTTLLIILVIFNIYSNMIDHIVNIILTYWQF